MKHLFTLLFLVPVLCPGQNFNYVQREANSPVPGTYNTLVGPNAGNAITYGYNNNFFGSNAGYRNTSGGNNNFIGNDAGSSNTVGNLNTFIGTLAGALNENPSNNVFIGYSAGFSNTQGEKNTLIGNLAGRQIQSGSRNTYVGYEAGYNGAFTTNNVLIGYQAGYYNQAGTNNVLIGPSSGTSIVTSSNCIMLGANTQIANEFIENGVAIGTGATVARSNAIVLGDYTNPGISVGIGTNDPQFPLDVRGTINLRNNGKIKFAHLSNPLFQGTTDQFLTVNEQGETVLATYRLRINNTNQWSDKVFSPTYQLKPLLQVEQYIQQNNHLPDVPSAEQVKSDGVDLVKMNALLLQKVEELTLYSIQQQKENQTLKSDVALLKALMKQVLEKK